jgi:hypothetical protein
LEDPFRFGIREFRGISRNNHTTNIIKPSMFHIETEFVHHIRDNGPSRNEPNGPDELIVAERISAYESEKVFQSMSTDSGKRIVFFCREYKLN